MLSIAPVLRLAVALGCLFASAWPHYAGRSSFARAFWLLLALAGAGGLMVARWWVLLFAPIPWLVGVGHGVYAGRYPFLDVARAGRG